MGTSIKSSADNLKLFIMQMLAFLVKYKQLQNELSVVLIIKFSCIYFEKSLASDFLIFDRHGKWKDTDKALK